MRVLVGLLAVACAAALPLGRGGGKRGDSVSVVGEGEGQTPIPYSGANADSANKAAAKAVADQEAVEVAKAREEADQNVEMSNKMADMPTDQVSNIIDGMTAAQRPIDVMVSQYKSLHYSADTTLSGVARAQEQERRIAHSERAMKAAEKQHSAMLQGASVGKIPTIAGLKAAVKTTIDANMKEAVGQLPFGGQPTWDDILPSVNDYTGKSKGQSKVAAASGDMVLKSEKQMLTERQKAVAHKEKKLAEEKKMLKGQMLNVAEAANNLQEKFQNEEDQTDRKATKKVQRAAMAVMQARKVEAQVGVKVMQEKAREQMLKQALTNAVADKFRMKRALVAKAAMGLKVASMQNKNQVQGLQHMAQAKIKALATASTKIAQQLFEARRKIKQQAAKIRFLKSKLVLEHRRALRKESQIADRIKSKEDSFWSKQMDTQRAQTTRDEGSMNQRVQSAVKQSAKVSNEAMHDEKRMQKKLVGLKSMKAEAKVTEAVKVHKSDSELTKDNTRLHKENADLHEQLGLWQKKAAQFASAQEGQRNANKRLVHLIHKVSREREDSDKAAAAASADANIVKAQLRNVKSKLDFPKNFTKPGSKETHGEKQEIDSLLKTPTLGKGPETKGAAKPESSKVIGNAKVKVGEP